MVWDFPVPGGPWINEILGIGYGKRIAATVPSMAAACDLL